jgi:outer membrane lipoprotein SlyB
MKITLIFASLLLLVSCAQNPGQNRYNLAEAGRASEIEKATILKVKEIDITGQNTGVGAAAGISAGAIGGSYVGDGRGQLAALLVGAIVGGIAGHIAEKEMQNTKGYEYRLRTESKKVKTIVQHQHKDDVVFKKGDKVLLQTQGIYQRVLADD